MLPRSLPARHRCPIYASHRWSTRTTNLDYQSYIRNWPGNSYSDLTHLLSQPQVFPALVEAMASPFADAGITRVAAVDAGGFAVGGGVAQRLQAGLVLIRKAGRIAWAVETATCTDWSGAESRSR